MDQTVSGLKDRTLDAARSPSLITCLRSCILRIHGAVKLIEIPRTAHMGGPTREALVMLFLSAMALSRAAHSNAEHRQPVALWRSYRIGDGVLHRIARKSDPEEPGPKV